MIGLCFPGQVFAANGSPLNVADVELQSGGLLVGQVIDTNSQRLADTEVAIWSNGDTVAVTRTDASGMFAVRGLRGGLHEIRTANSDELCRLWTPGTAPPGSTTGVRIAVGGEVVRGQWGPPPGNNFLKGAKVWATNPFVIGGIIAAAVAIPVALHNADEDSRS
jgi:hypothetical protein